MALLDVLDRLRHRAARRTESAAETLWANAKRLAADESADDDAIESALAETRTTLDGFNELVDLARKRRRLFVAVDKATPASVKRDKLAATAAAERAAFEETRRRWLERAAVLDAELAVLDKAVLAGDEAREALCSPANLPPAAAERLQAALDAKQAAVERVGDVRRALNEQRDIHARRLWMAEQKRGSGRHHPLDADDDERLARRAVTRIGELEAGLRDAEAAAKAADEHLTKCRTAVLKT
jgi:hypothetical protein